MKRVIFPIAIILFGFSAFAQTTVTPGGNNNGSFFNFPINGETQSVSASSSSSSITFSTSTAIASSDVLVSNGGTVIAFVGCGVTSVTANLPGVGNLQSLPVLAGETMVLRKGVGSNVCAAITSSSTTTVYFTAGQGI